MSRSTKSRDRLQVLIFAGATPSAASMSPKGAPLSQARSAGLSSFISASVLSPPAFLPRVTAFTVSHVAAEEQCVARAVGDQEVDKPVAPFDYRRRQIVYSAAMRTASAVKGSSCMPLNAAIFTVAASAACASASSASFSEASLASNAASTPPLRAWNAANDQAHHLDRAIGVLLLAFGGAQPAQEVAHVRVIAIAELDAVEQGRQRIIDRDALVVRREHFASMSNASPVGVPFAANRTGGSR